MAKISDEIRKWCADLDSDDILCTTATLYTLADRIDSEMVELPRDRGGAPIHVGDTVYLDDGRKAEVRRIQLSERENSICFDVCGDFFSFWPENLTHTRPDSLERIADELDEMKESFRTSDSDTFFALQDLAGRVHTQAKEREHE